MADRDYKPIIIRKDVYDLLRELAKRERRSLCNMACFAILEYAKYAHPDLYKKVEALA